MTGSSKNVEYSSPAIEAYYRDHRVRWDEFYESERAVLAELGLTPGSSVLDVGCGCGGLGLALRQRFGVGNYTGVEINRQAAEKARQLNPAGRFLWADILSVSSEDLADDSFDVVVSLSCIDWNVQFNEMLTRAYRFVKPGGCLVASFRLTEAESIIDSGRSYQFINFDGKREGEIAPYVILNFGDFMRRALALAPWRIRAVGYWGAPSPTAVTPMERIVFAAVALWKRREGEQGPVIQLDLPPELMAGDPEAVPAAQARA